MSQIWSPLSRERADYATQSQIILFIPLYTVCLLTQSTYLKEPNRIGKLFFFSSLLSVFHTLSAASSLCKNTCFFYSEYSTSIHLLIVYTRTIIVGFLDYLVLRLFNLIRFLLIIPCSKDTEYYSV